MAHRDRRSQRRGDSSRPRGRGQGRKPPPPEATGEEAKYLHESKEAKTRFVFRLVSGESIDGTIEYFDRDMIKVTRPEGPNLFVRKSQIRYFHEADE